MDENPYQSPLEPAHAARGNFWPAVAIVVIHIGLGLAIVLPLIEMASGKSN